jgi:hypothetical protein
MDYIPFSRASCESHDAIRTMRAPTPLQFARRLRITLTHDGRMPLPEVKNAEAFQLYPADAQHH